MKASLAFEFCPCEFVFSLTFLVLRFQAAAEPKKKKAVRSFVNRVARTFYRTTLAFCANVSLSVTLDFQAPAAKPKKAKAVAAEKKEAAPAPVPADKAE